MLTTFDHRSISGLRSAALLHASPFAAKRELRSPYKRGLAYERKVGRTLQRLNRTGRLPGELHLGQWISYNDANGHGYAQPDAYLVADGHVLLAEVKLTQTDAAEQQLQRLYKPLLQQLYGLPVLCLQVCRRLRHVAKRPVSGPAELLAAPRPGTHTWHFRGDG